MSGRLRRYFPMVAVVLAGCAATPNGATGIPATINTTGGVVAVREDLSSRFVALIGPKVQHDPPYLGIPGTNFSCLRSFVDRRTGESAHQLFVAASYEVKRDWSAARDSAGQNLPFLAIGRYPIVCAAGDGNCSYAEEFAAKLPESELQQNPSGFAVTFTAAGGAAQTIAVSPMQVSAQLAALADLRKLQAAEAAAATAHP